MVQIKYDNDKNRIRGEIKLDMKESKAMWLLFLFITGILHLEIL